MSAALNVQIFLNCWDS